MPEPDCRTHSQKELMQSLNGRILLHAMISSSHALRGPVIMLLAKFVMAMTVVRCVTCETQQQHLIGISGGCDDSN